MRQEIRILSTAKSGMGVMAQVKTTNMLTGRSVTVTRHIPTAQLAALRAKGIMVI